MQIDVHTPDSVGELPQQHRGIGVADINLHCRHVGRSGKAQRIEGRSVASGGSDSPSGLDEPLGQRPA